jgi:hypothetical protein
MPEQNATGVDATQGASADKPERTFTQAEMEAIIGERLKREKAKYADYSELQAKAAEYDKAQEASKSELQKAVEERDSLKSQLDALQAEKAHADAVAKAASEHGVDAALLARMSGDVEENALYLKSSMASVSKYGSVKDGGEATPPTVTRESIEAIKDPVARVRARAEHLDFY